MLYPEVASLTVRNLLCLEAVGLPHAVTVLLYPEAEFGLATATIELQVPIENLPSRYSISRASGWPLLFSRSPMELSSSLWLFLASQSLADCYRSPNHGQTVDHYHFL
ncbi:hypothetical protein PoB_001658200 [Plakobranchus ocellatus]|uniref:Uncharacterized protein n=1 Tax=Plakobranchus ocellatus TaxID=259542 RepID=A0AAV3Z497_9GAST|nr:hypothetical protein PoB_001658200 [Plakobranchus ocellatus]